MKIETIRKSYWKGIAIVAFVAVVILLVLNLRGTQAKYQTSQSVPLIQGTINFKQYDFKIMAMYQENDTGKYDEVEVMPTSGYVINEEESYCYTVTQEERDDTVSMYTNDAGEHVFGNLKKASKCYLWFDKEPTPANEYIIANATSTTTMPSITGISTDTSNALYTVADDDGTSYVFRGNPSNNWVSFGGFYWRIIRINGDGSIRMIYNGTSTTTTGTGLLISGYYAYNSNRNDNAYVGFMYGQAGAGNYATTHTNTNNSTIKGQLDSWYSSSGLSSYAEYIDTNAGFCNDRTTSSTADSSYGTSGYGANATAYASWGRLAESGSFKTTQTPSLKCPNASSDLFTMTSSNKGNKKLSSPVGLITSDEVVYAGGFGGTANSNFYLYANQYYWTMSPCNFNGTIVGVFNVYSNGSVNNYDVSSNLGVRPVINLKSNVTLTGEGTTSSPYKVS